MNTRVAFITGASRGIGACSAVALAEAGYKVAVRRQPTWDQWARFLRDTFLPVASPV